MASAKRTPKVSRITRDRTVAYARKQKSPTDAGQPDSTPDSPEDAAPETTENLPGDQAAEAAGTKATATGTPAPGAAAPVGSTAPTAGVAPAAPVGVAPAVPTSGAKPEATAPAATAPPSPGVEPGPDATPVPMKPVEPARAPADTITEPGTKPARAADAGAAEDPTRMPGPREIPPGNPDEPASPPGFVPRGDSRSLRRRTDVHEFALIYRVQTHVITRFGKVGTRGQWRVVEYPTSASASHAYAKECSRFVSDGFSDYRS